MRNNPNVAENSIVGWLVLVVVLVLVLENTPISTMRTRGFLLDLTIGVVRNKGFDLHLLRKRPYGKMNLWRFCATIWTREALLRY